jgi:hypothetical protein
VERQFHSSNIRLLFTSVKENHPRFLGEISKDIHFKEYKLLSESVEYHLYHGYLLLNPEVDTSFLKLHRQLYHTIQLQD